MKTLKHYLEIAILIPIVLVGLLIANFFFWLSEISTGKDIDMGDEHSMN